MKAKFFTLYILSICFSCQETEIKEAHDLFNLEKSLESIDLLIEKELDHEDLIRRVNSGLVESNLPSIENLELSDEAKQFINNLNSRLGQLKGADEIIVFIEHELRMYNNTELIGSDYEIVFSLLLYHSITEYIRDHNELLNGRINGCGTAVAVGAVVGAALGGIFGGAIGTLIAPGPGSVAGGITGGEAGAALGAILGAGAGALIGYSDC